MRVLDHVKRAEEDPPLKDLQLQVLEDAFASWLHGSWGFCLRAQFRCWRAKRKFGKPYFTTTMRWGVAMRGGPWLFPRPSANNGAPCVADPCETTYSVHVPFLATVRLVHQNKLACAGLESIELFAAHRPL